MYQELVYHLDLCILSYQLYGQTLAFPMDPYYEQMARNGTSRRDNFMKWIRTHDEQQGFPNPDHDPVVFNYEQMNPWKPCFAKPEDKWDVFNAPTVITNPIRKMYMVGIDGAMDPDGRANPDGIAGKTDDIFCFEGETGIIEKENKSPTKGSRSFMGFILARQIAGGDDYDIHIVFRGSRSGSGSRAAMQAKFKEKGNPDWITDMDFGLMVRQDTMSNAGRLCRGFQASVKTMQLRILNCLVQIQRIRTKAPRRIYVTGHSLGGALAVQFGSMLMKRGLAVPPSMKNWPFDKLKVYTYGAPVVGDRQFCEFAGVNMQIIRVLIGTDPIPQVETLYTTRLLR